jgi:protoheme IX farnesyltransferase
VVATLVGGSLSAGGANVLNSYYDRDIDALMSRTSARPLPAHQVEPGEARLFGWILGGLGFVWLWAFTNVVAAVISTMALLFYVFVYTRLLKRTTPQNIVIGGAAGAVPALVGWAAVRGSVALPAWILFAVVFYWTPPHFWALSLRFRDDYAAVGVPMLPVVAGVEATTRRMLAYSGVLVLVSLALVPVAGMGWLYLLASAGLGGWLMWEAFAIYRDPGRAMRFFAVSNYYLAALFASVMLDVLV